MNSNANTDYAAEDSATLRRLGIAVGCMVLGALMLVVAAATVGNLLG